MRFMIALAMFPFLKDMQNDMDETLKKISKMGYDGIEMAGGFSYDPNILKEKLDKYHLSIVGWHTGLENLDNNHIYSTIAYMQALGNMRIIVPYLPEGYASSINAWMETAHIFNKIAEVLEKYQMSLGYHNHSFEFIREEGKYHLEYFCEKLSDKVFIQLDVGNMLSAACNPVSFMKRHEGRFQTIHLKPYSFDTGFDTIIGEDDVDYISILKECEKSLTQCLLIEFESLRIYGKYEGAQRCYEGLKTLLEGR